MRIISVPKFVIFVVALAAASYLVLASWTPVSNFSIALLSNAAFSGVLTVLGFLALVRFEKIQIIVQKLFGIQIGKAKYFIQIILCGVGGAGKTSFIQRVFQHVSNIPGRTCGIRTHAIRLTYRQTLYTIHIVDYEGKQPTTLLGRVRWLYTRHQPVHYIFFMVSFYKVPDTREGKAPAQPYVPGTREKRRAQIGETVKVHSDLLSTPMLLELFAHSRELRRVFLLINQVDLLNASDEASVPQRAHAYFDEIFKRIKNYAPENVRVDRLLVSAREGLEFRDQKPHGLCIIERILRDFPSTPHEEE